jgi:hypothetical protein
MRTGDVEGRGNRCNVYHVTVIPGEITAFLETIEGVRLNQAFARIKDARARRKLVELVTVLAEADAA